MTLQTLAHFNWPVIFKNKLFLIIKSIRKKSNKRNGIESKNNTTALFNLAFRLAGKLAASFSIHACVEKLAARNNHSESCKNIEV